MIAGPPQMDAGGMVMPLNPDGTPYYGTISRDAAGKINGFSNPTQPQNFAQPAGGEVASSNRDAFAYLQELMDQYGLGGLTGFVKDELTQGRGQNEIALDLRKTPEFAAAFPEIAARKAAGLPAIGPGEIISYRNAATQMMREAGLPKGFYDSPADFAALIGANVSVSELSGRINEAKTATFNMDPAAAARLNSEFGLTAGSGDLAAYFLDPQKALPLLQQQVQAAKIGGAADNTGYLGVSNDTALQLAKQGVTDGQARQGFSLLGGEQQLMSALPGQSPENISQQEQVAAVFAGNAGAQQRIERVREQRKAVFADGGGFASSNTGIGGLGSVPS